jgi:hypothetical protein
MVDQFESGGAKFFGSEFRNGNPNPLSFLKRSPQHTRVAKKKPTFFGV